MGALIGASLGGNSNEVTQSAQMSLRTEQFNRQLHPKAVQWIKDNAKKFAEEQGISIEDAEMKLLEIASKKVDYLASVKIDSEQHKDKNDAAERFLLNSGNGYFIELDKDKYDSPYINALELSEYDAQNNGYYSKKLRSLSKNNVYLESIKNGYTGIINYGNSLVNNPSGTMDATSIAFRNGFHETMTCLKEWDCVKSKMSAFNHSMNDLITANVKYLPSHSALNYLYGEDVSGEVSAIAGVRALGVTLEAVPIAKGAKDLAVLGKSKLPVVGKTTNYENQITRISNPYSPYLEIDKHGNEIYYRALSEPDYKRLLIEGKLPATNETFISPLSAYSKKYEGVLVRFYTKPGTSLSLQEIGVAGNSATKREVFPNMNRAEKGWSINNQTQFKLEGRRKNPEINDGKGVVNTGLGKTEGLNRFNENIIKFEKIDR